MTEVRELPASVRREIDRMARRRAKQIREVVSSLVVVEESHGRWYVKLAGHDIDDLMLNNTKRAANALAKVIREKLINELLQGVQL